MFSTLRDFNALGEVPHIEGYHDEYIGKCHEHRGVFSTLGFSIKSKIFYELALHMNHDIPPMY